MRSGLYRFLVNFQEPAPVTNFFGENAPTWQTFATVHADIRDLAGVELWRVQQLQADSTVKVCCRWFPNVHPRQRITYRNRVLEITTISNPDGRKREMVILCKEAQ